MHDPMVVAFEILRPWPQTSSFGKPPERRWEIRHHHEHHDDCGCPSQSHNPFPWYRLRSYSRFWTLAGRRFYWPALITVWHVDPGGYDSFDKCKRDSHWQLHVHHWKIQLRPLQAWRRRLLTRCEWCGGPSRKRDAVNISHSWDGPKNKWWRGEKGLYHHECSTIESAYRTCTCPDPLLDHEGYGKCALCGRFRGYGAKPEWLSNAEKVRDAIAENTRDRAAYALIFVGVGLGAGRG